MCRVWQRRLEVARQDAEGRVADATAEAAAAHEGAVRLQADLAAVRKERAQLRQVRKPGRSVSMYVRSTTSKHMSEECSSALKGGVDHRTYIGRSRVRRRDAASAVGVAPAAGA